MSNLRRGLTGAVRRRVVWCSVAALAAGLVAAGAIARFGIQGEVPADPLRRFPLVLAPSQALPAGAGGPLVALSPDGQTLVYHALEGGVSRLYRRAPDQLDAAPIPGTEGARATLFFSPDGKWLGFVSENALMKVALAGGRPVRVAELPSAFRGASWGPDDTIVVGGTTAGLLSVPAAGGKVTTLAEVHDGRQYWYPHVLPHGRAVLFTASSQVADAGDVFVLDLTTGVRRTLVAGAVGGWYAPTGHLIFLREGDLWAVAFDQDRLEVRGDAVPVERDIRVEEGGAVQFAASTDGSLVYLPSSAETRVLVWMDREGREEPLQMPPRAYLHPRISPDGTRVALELRDNDAGIWIWDLMRPTLTRLTFGQARASYPVWMPDSRRIVYSEIGASGPRSLFLVPANGTSRAEPLVDSLRDRVPSSASPDGLHLLFREMSPQGSEDLWMLLMNDPRTAARVVATSARERNGEISPNGRWVAYQSTASGRNEIYVRAFPGGEGLWQVSVDGGEQPVWARDGRTLFYVAGAALMGAPVDQGPAFAIGTPKVVLQNVGVAALEGAGRGFDVAPDGQRFLIVRRYLPPDKTRVSPDLIVVQNWLQELKRLVPTN